MSMEKNVVEAGLPLKAAAKALILLHGRGANAESIMPLADRLAGPEFYVVAPQAPGRVWYPESFMAEEERNEPWLSNSLNRLGQITQEIQHSIPLERIYIVGFSQGACLTLEFMAWHGGRFGGAIAFTGGLIGKQLVPSKYQGKLEGTPIFIGNGDQDPHVPLARSQESKQILEQMGAEATLAIYPGMPHTIIEEELIAAKEAIF